MVTYFFASAMIAGLYLLTTKVHIVRFRERGVDFRWLMLVPFVILLLFSANNPDYQVYKESFETGYGPYYETGIRIIADILGKLRLNDYRVFLLLVASLVYFVFRLWNRKIENIGMVVLLYSLFIMYYDVIQIRFTIAMMFVLLSLYYTIDKKWAPAFLFAAASVFFHRLAALPCLILFYLFVIRPRKDYSLSGKEAKLLIVVGLLGSVFSRKAVELIAGRSAFFSRITLYITNNVGYDSLVIWVGYEVFLIAAIYWLGLKAVIQDPEVDDGTKAVSINLFRFMLFGITVSGFMLYVEEFNRMYRLFYLAGYLLFAYIEKFMKGTDRLLLFWAIIVVSILFMMVAMLRGINFDLYW